MLPERGKREKETDLTKPYDKNLYSDRRWKIKSIDNQKRTPKNVDYTAIQGEQSVGVTTTIKLMSYNQFKGTPSSH